MRASKTIQISKSKNQIFVLLVLMVCIAFVSCKRDITEQKIYDNVIYEVNPVNLYLTNADKTKQKTSTQYTAIMYSDLFHSSIPGNVLNQMNESALSVGDKSIVNSLILQKALVTPGVDVPTNPQMRNDLTKFVSDTYIKFYLRNPTPYEAYYMKKMIEEDAAITPQMIYAAFILSNEYNFY